MSILNYMKLIKIYKKILKRLKLLFLREELVQLSLELNSRYDVTNEYCKKKEWRVFDNIHKTLNVLEEEKNKEISNNTLTQPELKWYNDRVVDIALKTFIVVNK